MRGTLQVPLFQWDQDKVPKNISDIVLLRIILGPFQHLLKPFSYGSGDPLIIKITSNKKMNNFTYKMALVEFQFHSADKITHEMLGKQKTDKRINSQFRFIFFHQSILFFFSCQFFSINLKPFSPVCLIFHRCSPITGRYFGH